MSITAAAMVQLLTLTQERNYYQMQQIYWSNEHSAIEAQVSQYSKLEAKWEKEYDNIMDASGTRTVTFQGVTYGAEGSPACNAQIAEAYANSMVQEYDEEVMIELSNLEVEYESMQQMYETLLEETNARIEQQKELVSTNAKDTGLLSGG